MNTTLAKAAEMVTHVSQGNWDCTTRASQLEFPDFNHLRMKDSGAEYNMLPSAKRLISHRLRLPAEYLERCPEISKLRISTTGWNDLAILRSFAGSMIRASGRFSPDAISQSTTSRSWPGSWRLSLHPPRRVPLEQRHHGLEHSRP